MKRKKKLVKQDPNLTWLPIDSRLIPPLFRFSNIRGLAKVFVILEMILSSLVVLGTFILVGIYLLQ